VEQLKEPDTTDLGHCGLLHTLFTTCNNHSEKEEQEIFPLYQAKLSESEKFHAASKPNQPAPYTITPF